MKPGRAVFLSQITTMNESFFDFGTIPRDETQTTIRVNRPMLIQRHGEQLPRHAAPGEVVSVPAWILAQLPADGWERVDP
jgi:hypothetical protein